MQIIFGVFHNIYENMRQQREIAEKLKGPGYTKLT